MKVTLLISEHLKVGKPLLPLGSTLSRKQALKKPEQREMEKNLHPKVNNLNGK